MNFKWTLDPTGKVEIERKLRIQKRAKQQGVFQKEGSTN